MLEKKKILIVDDEQLNLKILEEILYKEYQTELFESGDDCLSYLNEKENSVEQLPELILMDVKMPGTNGLECCKIIKSRPAFRDIPVIFISALVQAEDRIAGYEAGADDYIVKPFEDDELKMKLKLVLENRAKIQNKSQDYQEALSTAMTAMTNASEIGIILRFFQDIFSAQNIDEINRLLMTVIHSYGLQATLAINIDRADSKLYSSTGVVKPLEVSLIKELRQQESIFHFGKRSLFNVGCVSLLVLNMPVENEELYGRLKEHLAMISKGLQSRVEALFAETERNEQREKLTMIMSMVQQLMTIIEESQMGYQREHNQLMNELVDKVEGSFVYLGLTDEQEKTLTGLIRETESKASALFDKEISLQEKFDELRKLLEEC